MKSSLLNQYNDIKKEFASCIVFFQIGDFYEIFDEDAKIASKILGLNLTNRMGKQMCGMPKKAYKEYVYKLSIKGYRVAIFEETKEKNLDGIYNRKLKYISTPGTAFNENESNLESRYILSIYQFENNFAISYSDISSGEFVSYSINDIKNLIDEIIKISPKEIIINYNFKYKKELELYLNTHIYEYAYIPESVKNCRDELYRQFGQENFLEIQILDELSIFSSCFLISYIKEIQNSDIFHISKISLYYKNRYMDLSYSVISDLELLESYGKNSNASLFYVLNKTKTAMGARLLKHWISNPLGNIEAILLRQEAIDEYIKNIKDIKKIQSYLEKIEDLDYISAKISYKRANYKDFSKIIISLRNIKKIYKCIFEFKSKLNLYFQENLDILDDVYEELVKKLDDDGIFLKEIDTELDSAYKSLNFYQNKISEIEKNERIRTGIKKLKIKENKRYGYFIEIPKGKKVPSDYILDRLSLNNEIYTTDELKLFSSEIIRSNIIIDEILEYRYREISDFLKNNIKRIKNLSLQIASIDCLCSLSIVSKENNYIKPKIYEKGIGILEIEGGRHPVLDLKFQTTSDIFVANDIYLDNFQDVLAILTGPNMSGKSTFMRQNALIIIMAHIGSFVPARLAKINIIDKIFTRIGASDDIENGDSTFMIEMKDIAHILQNATSDSFIILDEVGRGTSAKDGVSIAWAIIEYIATTIKSKTIFATHYHELIDAEGIIDNVFNISSKILEENGEIKFLRNIVRGGMSKSYGIYVAKLAGLPENIINRAKEIQIEMGNKDFKEMSDKNYVDYKEISKVLRQSRLFWSELTDELSTEEIILIYKQEKMRQKNLQEKLEYYD